MKNFNKYIIVSLFGLLAFTGCQQEEYKLGQLTTPTNLTLEYEIVGADAENPFGDGSGQVNFTATANDYITFNFKFGDGKDDKIAQNGKVNHVFSVNGINTYNVTVLAVGTGGITTSKTAQIEVFSSFTDDEALEMLTGGSSKTWYWAADQPGHVGLGPNFVDATNHTYPAWYSASPFEKECMYDAEFVFTKTANGLTFEQTAGTAYIPGTYAGKIGVEGDVCHGSDIVDPSGVKNVFFSPSSSVATIDGGYRGTSFSLSDNGFMNWWVGVSEYEIIKITDNILQVRIQEDATYAWYQTFTTVKPVQE